MGDSRQPLHVRAEQPAERFCLGLAQLRKVGGNVGDRAMVLAHLHASTGLLGGSGVAVGTERGGQRGRAVLGRDIGEHGAIPSFDRGEPAMRELGESRVTTGIAQVAERCDGKIVVRVRESLTSVVRQSEQLGRPPAPARLATNLALGRLANVPGCDQRIEMTADGGGGEPEPRAQRDRALGPVLIERPGDPIAGARVVTRALVEGCRGGGSRAGFHNDNVTYFPPAYAAGVASSARRCSPLGRDGADTPMISTQICPMIKEPWRVHAPTPSNVRSACDVSATRVTDGHYARSRERPGVR